MIELTPQQQQFIDTQIALGIFKEPADVVGTALELLRERQREYDQIRTAISQVERGNYELLDIEDVKRRGRERKS